MSLFHIAIVIVLAAWLAACERNGTTTTPVFHASENPVHLSEWAVISAKGESVHLSPGVFPYDLATPLFSDYAQKLRTIWVPEGKHAFYSADESFEFPVGTIISKTFYYPSEDAGVVTQYPTRTIDHNFMPLENIVLVETRLLVRREHGWDALPYIWNEAQTDAVLARAGAIKSMTIGRGGGAREEFAYVVPNINQCAACHASDETRKIQPIGLKARHLNKQSSFATAFNQLDHWIASGVLAIDDISAEPLAANANWADTTQPLEARARAYLDINCSHCHNPSGPADTSGLDLEPDASGPTMGTCKVPIAAGGGTGGRQFDIAPGTPDDSILLFRMETIDSGAMMPELGRALVHREGVALIAEWIASMEGACGPN